MKLTMSLRTRLLLGFAGMSLLVIAASTATFFFARRVNTTFAGIREGFSETQSLAGLQNRSQEVSGVIDRLFQTHQVDLEKKRLAASFSEFKSELEKIKQQSPKAAPEKNKEIRAILDGMQLTTAGMEETVAEILRLAEAGQWSIAKDMRETVLTPQQADLNEQMRKLAQYIEANVQGTFLITERSQDLTLAITITAMVLAIIMAGVLSLLSTRSITSPLNQLISVVQRVTLHDFSPVTPLPQKHEVGELSQSIALMTEWLRQSYESLEERVTERTLELERQNLKIQVAAEIARDASGARDLESLLDQSVKLIVRRFGFYHAGIFLLDESQDYAVLHAASGPSSHEMIESGHKLRVGEVGMVGYVAGSGKARIALDVGVDAVHFQNPLLPETRSEIALPMTVGSHMLGVLDVQSELPSAFNDDDINVLQILADLLAVGIHNAQLNTEIQESYLELENFYGRYSRESWRKVAHTEGFSGYQYDQNGAHPISRTASIAGNTSIENEPDELIPLTVRGDTIGILKVWSGENPLRSEEVELLEDFGRRVSQSLDSARLFSETQRRAENERLASQAATRMRESMDVESVLRSAAEDIYQVLNLEQLTIDISSPVPGVEGNGRAKK